MQVNPISFGNIIKFNGDKTTAEKVAKIAGKQDKAGNFIATAKIRNHFSDRKDGRVVVFSNEDGDCYLLSGKHSNKQKNYQDDFMERCREAAYSNFGDQEAIQRSCDSALKKYNQKVQDMIDQIRFMTEMSVTVDEKTGKIKSVTTNEI